MDIRKGTSSPADPSAPSFLRTLPSEIRNTVYDVLFKRNEPVLLHNAKTFRLARPKLAQHWVDIADYQNQLRHFDQVIETEIGQGQYFINDFQFSTPFLMTCRQVYSEAVGVLYGHNTFIFSRPLHRHDYMEWHMDWDHQPDLEHDMNYLPTAYAAQWLSGIGSNFRLLNKVEIDVGALCPPSCYNSFIGLPIFSLIELLWKHSTSGTISFTWREPSLAEKSDASSISHPFDETSMQRTRKLNAILHALGTADVLKLKRFGLTSRPASDMELERDLTGGCVSFVSRYNSCSCLIQNFRISDQGAVRWLRVREDPIQLHELPHDILSSIVSHASDGPDNLDKVWLNLRSVFGDEFGTKWT